MRDLPRALVRSAFDPKRTFPPDDTEQSKRFIDMAREVEAADMETLPAIGHQGAFIQLA